MVHRPYYDWMQDLIDGQLAAPARRQLEAHLADCQACGLAWSALSAADQALRQPTLAAPRPGFTGRFNARLAQRRSRPRLLWGAVALGLGAVASAALVVPLGLSLVSSMLTAARQPVTTLALATGLGAAAELFRTVLDALYIAARAVVAGAASNPLAWAAGITALLLTAVWLYVMRRLAPQGVSQ